MVYTASAYRFGKVGGGEEYPHVRGGTPAPRLKSKSCDLPRYISGLTADTLALVIDRQGGLAPDYRLMLGANYTPDPSS